ncbi:MAG: LptF/LptG family permease [Nitrospiraceae bacterium]|nr:LptF/LptG family permease [Nitrospiraceae bacterium]
MRLLKRFYLREFLVAFAVVVLGLSAMLSCFDLINQMDKLKSDGPYGFIKYILLVMPQYIVYTMPMAVLFASLFTVGHAVRNRETVAVMAAGGRMRALFMPLAAAGALLALASFGLSQFLAPSAMRQAKAMTGSAGTALFKEGTIWVRAEDGSLVRFSLYSKEAESARQVDIFQFSNGMLAKRIDAGGAKYRDGRWVLSNVTAYDLLHPSYSKSAQMTLSGFIDPKFLDKQVLTSDEMGITELYRYTRRLRQAGIRSIKLDVDVQSRFAYPVVDFFMVLFATAVSLRRGMSGLAAASLGVAVSLFYWLLYTFSLSLGYSALLPPLTAAWAVPLAFAAVSMWLFIKIRD